MLLEKKLESVQSVHRLSCGGRWLNYKGQAVKCQRWASEPSTINGSHLNAAGSPKQGSSLCRKASVHKGDGGVLQLYLNKG